jgi:hypothetical protein
MSVLLQDLLIEDNALSGYKRNPPLKQYPEIRKIGAEIVRYFLRNTGRDKLVKWEVEDQNGRGIVRLYLPLLHHHPQQSQWKQPLLQIIKTSERFNAPFRMFGDGTLICIEMEVKV